MNNIEKATVLKGKIPFANGQIYGTDRYYVVVKIDSEHYYLLNCSSVRGKQNKLMLKSNTELNDCIPPLKERTMVKMDEIYKIPKSCSSLLNILKYTLKSHSFQKLEQEFSEYTEMRFVSKPSIISYSYEEIEKCN
ncbi:hypothetical protein QI322_04430 [Staphylococcus saprophyticus]|nr:hypothetical protein [Staphylococcus saprophyticus]